MHIRITHQSETSRSWPQVQFGAAKLDPHVRPDCPPFEQIQRVAVFEGIRSSFLDPGSLIVRLRVSKSNDTSSISNHDSVVHARDLALARLVNDAFPKKNVGMLVLAIYKRARLEVSFLFSGEERERRRVVEEGHVGVGRVVEQATVGVLTERCILISMIPCI